MSWDGRNRRKFPRVIFPCLIKIGSINQAYEDVLTHTENVSSGGVRVILKKMIGMDSRVDVVMDLMDAQEQMICKGKVVWSCERKSSELVKPGFFDTGIEFYELSEVDRGRLEKIVTHHFKSSSQV